MKKHILVLLISLICLITNATTYYVSTTGNNGGTGTIEGGNGIGTSPSSFSLEADISNNKVWLRWSNPGASATFVYQYTYLIQ